MGLFSKKPKVDIFEKYRNATAKGILATVHITSPHPLSESPTITKEFQPYVFEGFSAFADKHRIRKVSANSRLRDWCKYITNNGVFDDETNKWYPPHRILRVDCIEFETTWDISEND